MMKQVSDPYAVLGIARDANDQQVRDAYRRLAKRYHPDLHPDGQTSERMRRVNQAWHVLSDPARRARYDAEHARVASPSPAYWSGPSRRQGAAAASARTWRPAWAATASATGPDSRAAGWGSSSWTSRPPSEPRPRADDGRSTGPPWLALVAVLAVGWLVVVGMFGGFLLPPGLGILALVAARLILRRPD